MESGGGHDARKEILIPIALEDFEKAVDFLKCLGWKCGVTMATKTYVFDYNGIEFALVSTEGLNYFEAEKLISKKSDNKKTLKEIQQACQDFEFQEFTSQQFVEELNKLNNRPGAKFDFEKQSFSEIKKRYKEFF